MARVVVTPQSVNGWFKKGVISKNSALAVADELVYRCRGYSVRMSERKTDSSLTNSAGALSPTAG
jgi:hypothetical protein